MSKICKNCWKERDHNNPLISRCKECQYKYSEANKKQTRISMVSKNNKNTSARFSKEVKAQILLRDKHCLFCNDWITDFHHCWYWWQAEYWPYRNDVNKWVWLCRHHHEMIHHFTDWSSQKIRQQCINYVEWFYK